MPCLRYMRNWIHTFVHDYERLKNLAKILIYIQIGCSLIGSIDVIYNYMSLINLGIALVGSSAIAMNNRSLARTYAVLLFSTVALDISWFVYSWYHILSMSIERTTMFLFIILLKMEMVGFYIRFLSTLVWIQMYRLEGISHVDSATTTSSRSKNDSDDDSGYSISNSNDANSSGDENQQHNHLLSKQELENEVQRLEMSSEGHGMLLLSNSVNARDGDPQASRGILYVPVIDLSVENAYESGWDSSNSSPSSVNSAPRLLLLSRLLNSFQHGPR